MKAIAIALPLLIAATLSTPTSARPFDLTSVNGQLVITIGKNDRVNHKGHTYRPYKKIRRADPLPPRKIARILERRGFYNLRKMRTDGRIYTVKARNPRGNLVRLTVNARNGKIIDRTILRRLQRVDRWEYKQNFKQRARWGDPQSRYPLRTY